MKKITQAVILAGGFNTRMFPWSKVIPKTMLPIEGKPIIHHLIQECVDSGIKKIFIITRDKKSIIEKYFSKNPQLTNLLKKYQHKRSLKKLKKIDDLRKKCKMRFIQQKEPLGEAHALLQAEKYIKGKNVAVMTCDIIYKSKEPVLKSLIEGFYRLDRTLHRQGRFVLSNEAIGYLSQFDYTKPRYRDRPIINILGRQKTIYCYLPDTKILDCGSFTGYTRVICQNKNKWTKRK